MQQGRTVSILSILCCLIFFVVVIVNVLLVPETASDLVFGVIGLIMLVSAVGGLVLGIVGISTASGGNRAIAIAGTVLSSLCLLLFLFFMMIGMLFEIG